MKIYTRTGDKGETSLFTGDRLSKDDSFFHALGTLDECNSMVGIALGVLPPSLEETRRQLIVIQNALFDVGAAVATPENRATEAKLKKTRFGSEATSELESWIDAMEKELPPLKTFILPGGHPAASSLHMARNICRRAERHMLPLYRHAAISDPILSYLNRLSDYFFMLARYVNIKTGCPETPWTPHQ